MDPADFGSPSARVEVASQPSYGTGAAPPFPAGFALPLLGGSALLLVAGLLLSYRIFFPNSRPNEILVISGRRYRRRDGQAVGYRVINGGSAFALPVIEKRTRMDVRTIFVTMKVENIYAKGGTPIDVEAIATVKISTEMDCVGNAIERFLDVDRRELQEVARKTLDGHLRATVATLTPEEVNEDRLRFAHSVAQIVREDMAKLGLQLDTFKVLKVTDKVDYLDSLGRARLADVLRDAAIAEAEGFGNADQREAEAEMRAEVARTQAASIIQQKRNELRMIRAQLEEKARSAEDRVEAVAAEARAKAEQELQSVRMRLERKRLEADEVLPAQARLEADEWIAKGQAAPLAENVKATAAANDMLAEVWREAGEAAAPIFLLEQLEMILDQAVKVPHQLKLGELSVLDNGDGKSVTNLVAMYPEVVRSFLSSVHDMLGIDVINSLRPSSQEISK